MFWEPSKWSEKDKIWRFLSDDPVHSKHLPAFLLTMPGRGQSCLSIFRNWRKEFLRNWEMFTYYHVNMYHSYFREREREKTKNCTVYKLFIHVYIYTLIWYMCIWYGVPCSYSNFECIFKSLRCSISTLVFDTSPPKSFAMDFPKNHRKCGVAYYSRRSACKCTWVRSSSCHFKHSSKGNNPVKGSKQ